eukprot:443437_1
MAEIIKKNKWTNQRISKKFKNKHHKSIRLSRHDKKLKKKRMRISNKIYLNKFKHTDAKLYMSLEKEFSDSPSNIDLKTDDSHLDFQLMDYVLSKEHTASSSMYSSEPAPSPLYPIPEAIKQKLIINLIAKGAFTVFTQKNLDSAMSMVQQQYQSKLQEFIGTNNQNKNASNNSINPINVSAQESVKSKCICRLSPINENKDNDEQFPAVRSPEIDGLPSPNNNNNNNADNIGYRRPMTYERDRSRDRGGITRRGRDRPRGGGAVTTSIALIQEIRDIVSSHDFLSEIDTSLTGNIINKNTLGLKDIVTNTELITDTSSLLERFEKRINLNFAETDYTELDKHIPNSFDSLKFLEKVSVHNRLSIAEYLMTHLHESQLSYHKYIAINKLLNAFRDQYNLCVYSNKNKSKLYDTLINYIYMYPRLIGHKIPSYTEKHKFTTFNDNPKLVLRYIVGINETIHQFTQNICSLTPVQVDIFLIGPNQFQTDIDKLPINAELYAQSEVGSLICNSEEKTMNSVDRITCLLSDTLSHAQPCDRYTMIIFRGNINNLHKDIAYIWKCNRSLPPYFITDYSELVFLAHAKQMQETIQNNLVCTSNNENILGIHYHLHSYDVNKMYISYGPFKQRIVKQEGMLSKLLVLFNNSNIWLKMIISDTILDEHMAKCNGLRDTKYECGEYWFGIDSYEHLDEMIDINSTTSDDSTDSDDESSIQNQLSLALFNLDNGSYYQHLRNEWRVGSTCIVFSRTFKKWIYTNISKIENKQEKE